jgi:hypothetical protein
MVVSSITGRYITPFRADFPSLDTHRKEDDCPIS